METLQRESQILLIDETTKKTCQNKTQGDLWVMTRLEENISWRLCQQMIVALPPSTELGLLDSSPTPNKPNWLSPFSSLVLRDRGCELFIDNVIAVLVDTSSSLSLIFNRAGLQYKRKFSVTLQLFKEIEKIN